MPDDVGPDARSRPGLDGLARRLDAIVIGDGDVIPLDVTHDSRAVSAGTLYCCVRGERADGHDFALAAIDAGAVALLVDHELDVATRRGVAQLVVADVRAAMGPAAAAVHGDPSRELVVIGVTGTNGKTTVVSIIGQLAETLGRPVRVIGTLTGVRTTPEATDVQRELRAAVDDGIEIVAMEVSSHALDLHRVDGIAFAAAAFTNLGRDHLDHHGTPERYFEAKARLFEPGRAAVRIVNGDDVHGRLLNDSGAADVVISQRDLDDLRVSAQGSRFSWRGHPVELALVGRFNVSNAVIAAECCVAIGLDPAALAAALGSVTTPPGRFEVIDDDELTVIVDYAHTPDALENLLETARDLVTAAGRLIVVFGCGGDRDASKRPAMGDVADRFADVIVITSDNPRSEDPSTIMAAVRGGVRTHEPILELDRRAGISTAIDSARPGDVVVIAGKGHETTQIIGDRELPFDDRVVAAEALGRRLDPPTVDAGGEDAVADR